MKINQCIGCGGRIRNNEFAHYCSKCTKFYHKVMGMKPVAAEVTKIGDKGTEGLIFEKMQQIRTRVLADDGVTVLKGEEGLKYMEDHKEENPGYAQRLKEYYEAKQ